MGGDLREEERGNEDIWVAAKGGDKGMRIFGGSVREQKRGDGNIWVAVLSEELSGYEAICVAA